MTRKHITLTLLCAGILVAALLVALRHPGPEVLYKVTFLPTMGGVETRAHAINDSGQVVSAVRMADGTVHIVLWDKSDRIHELASFAKGHRVVTLALNNSGQIAGTVIDPNRALRSFFWDTDGRQYALDTSGGGRCQIGALNNRGQVVGHWAAARGPRQAFLWDQTARMQDLGTFGGIESLAGGVNDTGQIVGFFSTFKNQWRAFLCDPNLGMRDLGPTRFGPAATCQINNRGFVVGQFGSPNDGACVSTWTAREGPRRLPSMAGDWLDVRALTDANDFSLNVSHSGMQILGRRLWQREESHLWQSSRDTGCLNNFLGRTDIQGLAVHDTNKDGTILGSLSVRKLPYPHAVILEPIK